MTNFLGERQLPKIENYEEISTIKSNETSMLIKAKLNGKLVMTKIYSKSNTQNIWIAAQEIKNLEATVSCPNIIRKIKDLEDENFIYIIFEYCEVSLEQFSYQYGSSENIKKFTSDMLKCLITMTEENMVHGCIKPEHVMFVWNDQRKWSAKIIDLAHARWLPDSQEDTWRAPELKEIHHHDMPGMCDVINFAFTRNNYPFNSNPKFVSQNLQNGRLPKSDALLLSTLLWPMSTSMPPPDQLLLHAFLFSAEQTLSFIDGCKGFYMRRSSVKYEACDALENKCYEVVETNNWQRVQGIPPLLYGSRYGSSLVDLIRLIRNKSEHYEDIPSNIRSVMGHPLSQPERFVEYFTSRFPALLAWVWFSVWPFRHEANLQTYFPSHNYMAKVPVEDLIF